MWNSIRTLSASFSKDCCIDRISQEKMRIRKDIRIFGYLSENAIRPFVVGRKGWLFCDTPAGAQASAIAYTMVEMAKANRVNPYHYITFLFEHQPNEKMSDDKLEQLAPWNENVKAEIQCRIECQNNQE